MPRSSEPTSHKVGMVKQLNFIAVRILGEAVRKRDTARMPETVANRKNRIAIKKRITMSMPCSKTEGRSAVAAAKLTNRASNQVAVFIVA